MRSTRFLAALVLIVGLSWWSGCSSTQTSRDYGGSYPGASANSHGGHNH